MKLFTDIMRGFAEIGERENIPELTEYANGSLLENGESGKYSWYYRESDKSDESGTVAEWALSTEDYMLCEEPVLPYFAVDVCEVK